MSHRGLGLADADGFDQDDIEAAASQQHRLRVLAATPSVPDDGEGRMKA